MGYYIDENSKEELAPIQGKAAFIEDDGGMIIPEPEEWREGIVCVVDQGPFDSAAYIFSPNELEEFKAIQRPKTWLYYEHAKNISGYGG